MKFLLSTALAATLLLMPATWTLAADTPQHEVGFVSLFDGKSLDGWKVGDNAEVFQAGDGMIVMECPATNHRPAHLFYVGDVSRHNFKNFDLKVDVMTFPGANSGIYFHTKYQEAGWPKRGIECQINNSHSDWRRTGSLYGIRTSPGARKRRPTTMSRTSPFCRRPPSPTTFGIPKRSSTGTGRSWSSSTARRLSCARSPRRTRNTFFPPG